MVARQAPWAEALIRDTAAMTAAADLLRDKATAKLAGSVHLGATVETGKIYYASPVLQPADLTAERCLWILAGLEEIAQAAERLPPPANPHVPSRFERFGQENPALVAVACLGCALAFLGGGALVLFALLALLAR